MRLDEASTPHASDWSATPWALREDVLKLLHRRAMLLPPSDLLALHDQVAKYTRDDCAPDVQAGVAVLHLRGLITPRPSFMSMLFGGGGGLQAFRQGLAAAVDANEVASILINVDSPGGSSALLPEVAAEIRTARNAKPIVAVANTMACSAAYWLASQADELVVTPSGDVGSIGVYLLHNDWSSWNEKFGIDPTYIYAGEHKIDGNPDEPLSDDARADLQQSVDDCYAMFLADVAKGRGVSASKVRSDYGEGRVLTAKRALGAGMVDKIATIEETLARLARNRVRGRRGATVIDLPAVTAEQITELAEAIRASQVDGDDPEVIAATDSQKESAGEIGDEASADVDTGDTNVNSSDDTTAGESDGDPSSPLSGGVDPEQHARIADVLFD